MKVLQDALEKEAIWRETPLDEEEVREYVLSNLNNPTHGRPELEALKKALKMDVINLGWAESLDEIDKGDTPRDGPSQLDKARWPG
jgi:hypothetical protein